MQRLCQCDVDTIGQWSDHQTLSISQKLISVSELSITNVDEAVFFVFVPSLSQLRLPQEGLVVGHILRDESLNNISGVHINGDEIHNLHTKLLVQISLYSLNQMIQLIHLLGIVVLHRVFIVLLESLERLKNLTRPVQLRSNQHQLSIDIDEPLVTRLLLVRYNGLSEIQSQSLLDVLLECIEPILNFTLQFNWCFEHKNFVESVSNQSSGNIGWIAIGVLLENECLDGLEQFCHVLHDQMRGLPTL
mmetsp:Transcript_10755/g.40253  ORF Transcript_10755/g.40253 Transcript_10755/m.40253 type:complete len:247 (+) Transcript_10755:7941-8681(+)